MADPRWTETADIADLHLPLRPGSDIALLNAGTYEPVTPDTFRAELFRSHLEVNAMGTIHCIESVLPEMLRRRAGRIAVVTAGERDVVAHL